MTHDTTCDLFLYASLTPLNAPLFHTHTSHIAHHTSHITHHTSHITHHTSHITHHPSHTTHHPSHTTLSPPTNLPRFPSPLYPLFPPMSHTSVSHLISPGIFLLLIFLFSYYLFSYFLITYFLIFLLLIFLFSYFLIFLFSYYCPVVTHFTRTRTSSPRFISIAR